MKFMTILSSMIFEMIIEHVCLGYHAYLTHLNWIEIINKKRFGMHINKKVGIN